MDNSCLSVSDFLFSRCIILSDNVLNFSSVCSESSRSVYNYTTLDQFQHIVTDLNLAFGNMTVDGGDLCYPAVQTYMCDYFFPLCVSNSPQAICKDSCDNYLHSGVCTNTFADLLDHLTTINSTIIPLFNTNCSASLQPLYGVEAHVGCNSLRS